MLTRLLQKLAEDLRDRGKLDLSESFIDASPLDDIRNTQKIRALILQGKLLDRLALDQLLISETQFAGSH